MNPLGQPPSAPSHGPAPVLCVRVRVAAAVFRVVCALLSLCSSLHPRPASAPSAPGPLRGWATQHSLLCWGARAPRHRLPVSSLHLLPPPLSTVPSPCPSPAPCISSPFLPHSDVKSMSPEAQFRELAARHAPNTAVAAGTCIAAQTHSPRKHSRLGQLEAQTAAQMQFQYQMQSAPSSLPSR